MYKEDWLLFEHDLNVMLITVSFFLQCDILNFAELKKNMTGASCVYHLASYGMSGHEQVNLSFLLFRKTSQNFSDIFKTRPTKLLLYKSIDSKRPASILKTSIFLNHH